MNRKIGIGADHAGFELKELVKSVLGNDFDVIDYGTNSDASVDYPDFGHSVATAVEEGKVDLGIVICGSGNGINITANKHKGVRSALCWEVEIASLARQHNDANILALPARFISPEKGLDIVRSFLKTDFEGGRHQNRINKI